MQLVAIQMKQETGVAVARGIAILCSYSPMMTRSPRVRVALSGADLGSYVGIWGCVEFIGWVIFRSVSWYHLEILLLF